MFDLTTVHDRRRNSGFLKQQALYYIALHCIALYCIVLYCMAWYGIACTIWCGVVFIMTVNKASDWLIHNLGTVRYSTVRYGIA